MQEKILIHVDKCGKAQKYRIKELTNGCVRNIM